eukprot:TRINITY_DN122007_c0_g1_i1.p1 TRINITY_DN122007_c0_g1~~TRINITY_DN122007_c0_g1_i1.p1  ORF type:complete len:592 (-),score=98.64 TRINITY_DN122007_c0_g1_i1:332-2107(-)
MASSQQCRSSSRPRRPRMSARCRRSVLTVSLAVVAFGSAEGSSATSVEDGKCVDQDDKWASHGSNCAEMSNMCDHPDYGTLVRKWCPRSCGLCGRENSDRATGSEAQATEFVRVDDAADVQTAAVNASQVNVTSNWSHSELPKFSSGQGAPRVGGHAPNSTASSNTSKLDEASDGNCSNASNTSGKCASQAPPATDMMQKVRAWLQTDELLETLESWSPLAASKGATKTGASTKTAANSSSGTATEAAAPVIEEERLSSQLESSRVKSADSLMSQGSNFTAQRASVLSLLAEEGGAAAQAPTSQYGSSRLTSPPTATNASQNRSTSGVQFVKLEDAELPHYHLATGLQNGTNASSLQDDYEDHIGSGWTAGEFRIRSDGSTVQHGKMEYQIFDPSIRIAMPANEEALRIELDSDAGGSMTDREEDSQVCPPGFEPATGHVHGGDQWTGYRTYADSLKDCSAKCMRTPGCGSFEYSKSTKRCWRNTQTRPTADRQRGGFVFCRRMPCPQHKTEEACVGPAVEPGFYSSDVSLRPGSYCIWSGGHCQAPMACSAKDCFLPDGGLPGMDLPPSKTLWISAAGLRATMAPKVQLR